MKWLTAIGLLIFCGVIISPLLVHHYVYPNIGDDSAVYLEAFEKMAVSGYQFDVQYLGYPIIGYLIIVTSNIFNIPMTTVFTWFSFIALVGIGISIYYVFTRLTDRATGWLALALSIFCAQGLLYYFYYGQIFNMINMGVIFPLLLFVTIRYITDKKGLIWLITLALLFGSFHTTGIYLPIVAGCATLIYIIVKRRKSNKTVIAVGSIIVGVSGLAFILFILLPTMNIMTSHPELYGKWDNMNLLRNIGKGLSVPFGHYVMDILSPSVLVLMAFSIVYIKDAINMSTRKRKMLFALLTSFSAVLIVAAFGKLSLDPWRQAVDFATILSLAVAIYVGTVWRQNKVLIALVVVIVGFGLFHNIPTWFGYNSAIHKADIQAIEYINKYDTFSSSDTIAYWIYERYTDCKWQGNDGQVVLMRNIPMTPRSDPENMWFQKEGWSPDNSYELTKIFSDGEVQIEVYEVKAEYR